MKFISKNIYLFFFVPFILLSCNTDPEGIYGNVSPVQLSSMPGTGRASAVAFAIDGKGYVVTGRGKIAKDSLKQLWQYDPDKDSWTEKAAFPGKPRVKAVAQVVNGKAYVGLGYYKWAGSANGDYKAFLSDFWSYNPATNSWEKLASFPGGDTDACFSFVLNNLIYVGSGYSFQTMNTFLWSYNTVENRWVKLNDLGGKQRFGAVGCSDGDKAFYGMGFNASNLDDWWEYDWIKDSWKKRTNVPGQGRVNGMAFSVSNRFFVSTGRYFNGNNNLINQGKLYRDIWEYEPEKNRWHFRGEIPGGQRENAVSFVIGNKVYLGFGENFEGILNDLWCFEP